MHVNFSKIDLCKPADEDDKCFVILRAVKFPYMYINGTRTRQVLKVVSCSLSGALWEQGRVHLDVPPASLMGLKK